jgi:hypothetical protein
MTEPDGSPEPAPWSFKLMIASAVIYLGWRLVQGVIWVIERVT